MRVIIDIAFTRNRPLSIASTIEVVLAALKQDTENTIMWFTITFMQVNPSKFQCMLLKPLTNKHEMPKFIEINGTNIPCEKRSLCVDKHVNIIYKKQLDRYM